MAGPADNPQRHSLAILDDYAGIAAKHFKHIPNLDVTVYKDTLSAHDPTELARLVERLKPHTMVSSMRERTAFPAALLSQLPKLRLLLTTGARNASIDAAYCAAHGITLGGTKGARPVALDPSGDPVTASSPAGSAVARTIDPLPAGHGSTTQHTLSLLLALTSLIPQDDATLKSPDGSSAWQSGLTVPLAGKVLGVLGLGKLGGAMARAAVLALGMRVVAWSESLTAERAAAVSADLFGLSPGAAGGAIRAVSKEELFRVADIVSVHYVLSDRSRGLVGAEELSLMKRSALLVNTARGPIVDEAALLDALRRGDIAGAALDVFWGREPLPADSPWRTEPWGRGGRARVVLSPHMGYVNEDTMEIWYGEQAADVEHWLAGRQITLPIK